MNLADLQSCFAAALLEREEGALVETLDGGPFRVSSLLALYRDSIEASLAAVLTAACQAPPAIAIAFIRSHPPKGAMLYCYAEEYAARKLESDLTVSALRQHRD